MCPVHHLILGNLEIHPLSMLVVRASIFLCLQIYLFLSIMLNAITPYIPAFPMKILIYEFISIAKFDFPKLMHTYTCTPP